MSNFLITWILLVKRSQRRERERRWRIVPVFIRIPLTPSWPLSWFVLSFADGSQQAAWRTALRGVDWTAPHPAINKLRREGAVPWRAVQLLYRFVHPYSPTPLHPFSYMLSPTSFILLPRIPRFISHFLTPKSRYRCFSTCTSIPFCSA